MKRIIHCATLFFAIFISNNTSFSQNKYYCPDVDKAYLEEYDKVTAEGYKLSARLESEKKTISRSKSHVTITNVKNVGNNITEFLALSLGPFSNLAEDCKEYVLSQICPEGYLARGQNIQCKGYRPSNSGENSYGGNITKDKNGVYTNKY